MEFHKIKKLTIVTETAILDNVLEIATNLGAKSYTLDRVSGKGESGGRFGYDISGILNSVRINIIASEETVKKIATEIVKKYFENYAGIVYLQDVEVIRIQSNKFGVSE